MERPVALKVQKGKAQKRSSVQSASDSKICIVHDTETKSQTVNSLTPQGFEKIKEAAKLRLGQSNQKHRLESISLNIPDVLDENIHGTHKQCYQRFTNTYFVSRKRSLEGTADTDPQPSSSKQTRRSASFTSAGGTLFPSDQCLFCDKNVIKIKQAKHFLVKCETTTAENSIKAAAESRKDEKMLCKILGMDLIAREAHYHNHCRRNYTRMDCRNPTFKTSEASKMLDAHAEAFAYISSYIEQTILASQMVERLSMLRERYLNFLSQHHPDAFNENYKTYKLKDKLVNHFGDRLRFCQTPKKAELVYSAEIDEGQAIALAFELASSDEKFLEEAALITRRHIDCSKRLSSEMPWPPSPQWLLSPERKPPSILKEFLSFVISGKSQRHNSLKVSRLVDSLSQDICYAATHGEWVMPKHLLLSMTVRHLTGSAELITILNRFGHCQSYTRTLELETAMCSSITANDSVLPPNISLQNNSVIHFCWDNFDLNEETPSGSGTTHSTHGIVIQEVASGAEVITTEMTPVTRDRKRTIQPDVTELRPCFLKPKVGPNFDIEHVKPDTDFSEVEQDNFIWFLSRKAGACFENQTVPSWAGWVSQTAQNVDEVCSRVEYMPPINFSINENATVQHIIEQSQAASLEVGQQYCIVTFDLAVAKKAYSLVWQQPDFKNVIVRMGVFHTICSIFGALGKKMKGSGLSEIVIEAGVCASGSLDKVMSGKHFNRALRVHKVMLEALERLLIQKFEQSLLETERLSQNTSDLLLTATKNPSHDTLQEMKENEDLCSYFARYKQFKQSVRDGHLGKTAQFWLSYMDIVWLILTLIKATKMNDLQLHLASLYSLCPILFAYDHTNYARYLPVYILTILNLNITHPGAEGLLRDNGISVRRSSVPLSRNAVDITIEQTINRHAKSQGGIIGFSRNYAAYYRWCVTRHYRTKLVEATLFLADIFPDELSVHKEFQPAQIKSSETATSRMKDAIVNFTDPFTVDNKDELFCIASGKPAPEDVRKDLLESQERGQLAMNDFIQSRLVDKSVPFHDPLKRLKLKTFASVGVVKKVKSTQNKMLQIKAERNIFGQLVLLSVEHNIDLQVTLSYPLGPVPYSLATADGMPAKTEKSKLLHHLESCVEPVTTPTDEGIAHVIDGNASLYVLSPVPENFQGVAEIVLDRLPKASRVDFVTDTYKEKSIKSFERKRRGTSEKLLISGPKTKAPKDWKGFMSNDENKTQLIKLLFSEWQKASYAKKLKGRNLYFAMGNECYHLTSTDGNAVEVRSVDALATSQEEADTRIILHCMHICETAPTTTHIIIRSPDTDVLVLLLKYAQQLGPVVLFDTGTSDKRRLINVKQIIEVKGSDLCSILPALHCFTGCDTVSSFVRRGKITPLKALQKYPDFIQVFECLGKDANSSDTLIDDLERFVCRMYGKPGYSSVNKLRYDSFSKSYQGKSGQVLSAFDGIDLSLLPPCRASLEMHVQRANHQAFVWCHAHEQFPNVPNPEGHGWKVDEDGSFDFEWTRGEIVPPALIDILCETTTDEGEDEEEEDDSATEVDALMDVVYEDDSDED
ncbi:MAG: hypothetical protein ABW118_17235 [Candidatus Thiodiazotropha sp.]